MIPTKTLVALAKALVTLAKTLVTLAKFHFFMTLLTCGPVSISPKT